MASQDTILTDLAIRTVGRVPRWIQQGSAAIVAANGVPSLTTDGVSVDNAVQALIAIQATGAGTWTGKLWGRPRGVDAPGAWFEILDSSVSGGSVVMRANIAGFSRIYFELVSITANGVVPYIAPCDSEGI